MQLFVTRRIQRSGCLVFLLAIFALASCTGVPEGIRPVQNFDAGRYAGKWYEIARLDHRFERGLSRVTAEYTLGEEGRVAVLNRGYSAEKQGWSEAEGRARFVADPRTGHLKVSFFGPFYASYVIFELDHENYQYAFVTGNTRDYLWLLARTPTISEALRERFVAEAKARGFDVERLIFVDQSGF